MRSNALTALYKENELLGSKIGNISCIPWHSRFPLCNTIDKLCNYFPALIWISSSVLRSTLNRTFKKSFFRILINLSGSLRFLYNRLQTTSLNPLLLFFLVLSPDNFLPWRYLDRSGLDEGVINLDSALSCSIMEDKFNLQLYFSLFLLLLLDLFFLR